MIEEMIIKPCPFCGNKYPEIIEGYLKNVYCRKCGCELFCLASTEEEAIEAWNKRYNDNRITC